MNWKKYGSRVEDYLHLDDRYELRFEYSDGIISTRTGTPVILLGGVAANGASLNNAIVMIDDVTKEEVEKLAAFVTSLRSRQNREC